MSKLRHMRGFLAWIVFIIFPNSAVAWGALAGLAVAMVLLIQDRREGTAWDALVLEASTLFFFAALSASAFAAPRAQLGIWGSTLSFGWLALTAWGSIALRQPFTLGIARQRVSREVSERPEFQHTHVALSRLWAIAFTVLAAVLAVCVAAHQGTAVTLAVRVAGLGIPAYLTFRLIKAARLRMAASAPAPEAAVGSSARESVSSEP